MEILIVIIFFHTLVVLRAKLKVQDTPPNLTVLLISLAMVAAVAMLMIKMEYPGL